MFRIGQEHGSRLLNHGSAALDFVLADLIEQCFVADLEYGRGLFAVPVGLLQGPGDGFDFSLILNVADKTFQSTFGRSVCLKGGIADRIRTDLQFLHGHVFIAENQEPFYEVSELAKIPWPWITFAGFHQPWGDGHGWASVAFRDLADEVPQQDANFLATLPKGWQGNRESVQAVIQIFAELLFRDGTRNINV